MMSVPRPAMLVAHGDPALAPGLAMIAASRSWYLAFSTSCGTPLRLSIRDRTSDFSTLVVPTSTGCRWRAARRCRDDRVELACTVW